MEAHETAGKNGRRAKGECAFEGVEESTGVKSGPLYCRGDEILRRPEAATHLATPSTMVAGTSACRSTR